MNYIWTLYFLNIVFHIQLDCISMCDCVYVCVCIRFLTMVVMLRISCWRNIRRCLGWCVGSWRRVSLEYIVCTSCQSLASWQCRQWTSMTVSPRSAWFWILRGRSAFKCTDVRGAFTCLTCLDKRAHICFFFFKIFTVFVNSHLVTITEFFSFSKIK